MGSCEEIVTLRNVCPCDCHKPKSTICRSGAVSDDQQGNCEVGREVWTWSSLNLHLLPFTSYSTAQVVLGFYQFALEDIYHQRHSNPILMNSYPRLLLSIVLFGSSSTLIDCDKQRQQMLVVNFVAKCESPLWFSHKTFCSVRHLDLLPPCRDIRIPMPFPLPLLGHSCLLVCHWKPLLVSKA